MEKFAFLVHPRHSARQDMGKVSPIFFAFPEIILEKIIPFFPPIKAGKSKFEKDSEVIGWIVWVPLLGKQMLGFPREIVTAKIVKAIKMVKGSGAKVVGLGEFTASTTHGGKDLLGKVTGIHLTSGNSLTTGVVFRAIEKIIDIKKIDASREKIAVVGAAGSIGQGVSALLAENNLKIILIDRSDKIPDLQNKFCNYKNIQFGSDIRMVGQAKVIAVATSSTKQLIDSKNLCDGAIIYDITQPRNTSPAIVEKRPDITIIDGGLIDTPFIDYGVDIGLKKNQAYACLAETVLLAMEGIKENFVGYTTPELAKKMLALMDKHPDQFKVNIYQSFGKKLDDNLNFLE